jgi:DNA-binding response OmpR family regulator
MLPGCNGVPSGALSHPARYLFGDSNSRTSIAMRDGMESFMSFSGGRVMKKKILVVDDEVNQGLLYEQELTDEGYEVDVTNSGQQALTMVKMKTYDLVILDIGMPFMDGLETLGKMLSMDNRLPVILNTAYPSYKDNFMSWAADAYVVKSSDLTELKEKIRESLAKRKG